MLSRYEEFLFEKQEFLMLELISEAFFIISPKLSEILDSMANSNKEYSKIANIILSMDMDNIDTNVSYLNITDDNSMISFLDPEKAEKFIQDSGITRSKVYDRLKGNNVRVGRLVRKLIDVYNKKKSEKFDYKDSDIEEFVNAFKANYDFIVGKTVKLEIMSGDKIKYVYDESNYRNKDGTLGSSCMRYEECQEYLKVYTDNENAEILALLDPNDKIIGRSIIWTLTDGNKFMDRVYTSTDSDTNHFKKYAEDNKILYKKSQSSRESEQILGVDGDYVEPKGIHMITQFKKSPTKTVSMMFPYMDTMKYYFWETGELSNYKIQNKYYVYLEDTDGGVICNNCDNEGVVDCKKCDGHGELDCERCGGDGKLDCERCDGTGDDCSMCSFGKVDCKKCDGYGELDCERCGGERTEKCKRCGGFSAY